MPFIRASIRQKQSRGPTAGAVALLTGDGIDVGVSRGGLVPADLPDEAAIAIPIIGHRLF